MRFNVSEYFVGFLRSRIFINKPAKLEYLQTNFRRDNS